MTEEIIDEEDWFELERGRTAREPRRVFDVSVRVTVAAIGRGGQKNTPKARVYVAFRGEAAKWIVDNGPRFSVAVGGRFANYIRIVPDNERGKFEWGDIARKTDTKRLNLGTVAAWPCEDRPVTEAQWDVSTGWMRLRLPDAWAVPTQKRLPPPSDPRPREFCLDEPKRAPAPSPAPARPLHSVTAHNMGDPPPNRSALNGR